jgi:hypothetical protein
VAFLPSVPFPGLIYFPQMSIPIFASINEWCCFAFTLSLKGNKFAKIKSIPEENEERPMIGD